jgi:hypothetical protein
MVISLGSGESRSTKRRPGNSGACCSKGCCGSPTTKVMVKRAKRVVYSFMSSECILVFEQEINLTKEYREGDRAKIETIQSRDPQAAYVFPSAGSVEVPHIELGVIDRSCYITQRVGTPTLNATQFMHIVSSDGKCIELDYNKHVSAIQMLMMVLETARSLIPKIFLGCGARI